MPHGKALWPAAIAMSRSTSVLTIRHRGKASELGVLALLIAFPDLALWLVEQMR